MVTFANDVNVCEYDIYQSINGLMSDNDKLSRLYDEKLSPFNRDENPCYRMSQMIKAWFEASYSDRCSGYWFATDVAQEHLANVIFHDKSALKGDYDVDLFQQGLEIMGIALRDKIIKMEKSDLKKTLFWNSNVAIGGVGNVATIHRFYEQYIEYKLDMSEITARLLRDKLRKREMDAIEMEISLISNIARKCVITEPKLYRHPTDRVW